MEAGRPRCGTWPQWLGPLLAVLPSIWLVAPLLGGHMPLSHDHPVHLFKAWQLWEHFLSEGRLVGWSHLWFFGYPAGELYPLGSDLWVALFRGVGLGQLSWPATYGLAFAAAFVFFGYAQYRLGAALFGPAVGIGAAWLAALDLGARREGGWIYTVEFGVWGQPLAMAFTFLGWASLHRLLERGRPRDGLWAAVWLALALLSHPTTLILLGFAFPVYALARRWGGARTAVSGLRGAAAAVGTAVALSGFWLLPFLARRELTLHIGTTWKSLAEVAASTLGGQLFQGQGAALTGLGLAALVYAIVRRRWQAGFLAVTSLALVVFGTTDVSSALGRLWDGFSRIQFQRMTIPAKALWQMLVAWGFVELWRGAGAWPLPLRAGSDERAPRLALRALLVGSAAFVLGSSALALHERSRELPLDGEVGWWQDFLAFGEWSREQREASTDFFRMAYWLPPDDHHLMAAPVYNGLPYYKVGYTPAKLFGRITDGANPALLRQLSARYVVTVSADTLDAKSIPLAARFGGIWVYELPDWRPQRHRLSGSGFVEELEMGSRRMALRLAEIEPGTRLVLHVAAHPRWEARIDGEPVAIEPAPSAEPGDRPILISLPARDGTLEIRWRAQPIDTAGWILTAAGLAALALQAWRSRVAPGGSQAS